MVVSTRDRSGSESKMRIVVPTKRNSVWNEGTPPAMPSSGVVVVVVVAAAAAVVVDSSSRWSMMPPDW